MTPKLIWLLVYQILHVIVGWFVVLQPVLLPIKKEGMQMEFMSVSHVTTSQIT